MSGERIHFASPLIAGASLAIVLIGVNGSPVGAQNAAARNVLAQQKGLVEQRGHWVLPMELELRHEFGSLEKLRQEMQKAGQAADQKYRFVVQQNAALELQIGQLNTRLQARQARMAQNNLGAVQQKILSEQISRDRTQLEDWQRQRIDQAQIGGFEPLKRQLVKLTNDRNELATTILKIHEQRQSVTEQYERLAQDRQVSTALATLGGGRRLGPLDDYHSKKFLAKIADYERDVFTGDLPLYRDNGELRVSGIIGRTPVTFTWRESSEPTMLTASVIEATGLEVPQNAARMQYLLPDGREVTVREFEVPYVRFGKQLLRSVKALALPPEAENIGTQIGPNAFEGLSPKAEPQNLRLVLN